MLERGTDVRPRRALPAFWRWEHTCARVTRDMATDYVVKYGMFRGSLVAMSSGVSRSRLSARDSVSTFLSARLAAMLALTFDST